MELKKTMKHSNTIPPEYKTDILPTELAYSTVKTNAISRLDFVI
jgi:hypothetical protein